MTKGLSPALRQAGRTFIRAQHRTLSYFGGCDYFRLSSDPRVGKAVLEGLADHGLNVAASRLTTGNHACYEALERALAGYFAAPSALVVPSGYVTNLAVAQAYAGRFNHAYIDERSHSSLWNATAFLECPVTSFRHRDPQSLLKQLRRRGTNNCVLLTDGVFPVNGAIAPLRAYRELLPRKTVLIVDDAHAAGVLGLKGRGTLELEGISRADTIQTVTLSKAFGVFGGAILGPRNLKTALLQRSSLFAGSTPLPLPLVAAAHRAVQLLRSDSTRRQRLLHCTGEVKKRLRVAGLALPEGPSPIIALRPKQQTDARIVRQNLWKAGIFPSFVRYASGPEGGYFRFALSSEHSDKQLDSLVKALAASLNRLNPVL